MRAGMETNLKDGDDTGSLSSLFTTAQTDFRNILESSQPSNSDGYQRNVQKVIKNLEMITIMVSQLSLFSRNEELDEVSTSSMRYFLLPCYLGELTLRKSSSGKHMKAHRKEMVNRSKEYLVDFLRRCKDYQITTQNLPESSVSTSGSGRESMTTMSLNRNEKIRKYKEQKERDVKLKELETAVDSGKADEQVERKYYKTLIEKWIDNSFEQLSSIEDELRILEHMAKQEAAAGSENAASEQGPPRPTPQSSRNNPTQLPVLILTRNELQKQVYGAGYPSIPTMTVAEFYQQRIEDGTFQQPGSRQSSGPTQTDHEHTDDSIETTDSIEKARQWDDWKDDHRRGWGNRKDQG